MRFRPSTLREWIAVVFAAIGIGLLPWTIWLSQSLPAHHSSVRWDLAWSGFDTGLALAFLFTAFAAWRRSPWVAIWAAATGTLLVADAWFDVILESHSDELRISILSASLGELPAAAFCFWIAYRAQEYLLRVVDGVAERGVGSHLAATRESPAEGDLVGVLEVPPDGEAARESRHSDPAP
jgi:hypothetical protein